MTAKLHPINELDRPRSISDLAAWLNAHGEPISRSQLHRRVKSGLLPVVRIGQRGVRTTARAYFAAMTPKDGV